MACRFFIGFPNIRFNENLFCARKVVTDTIIRSYENLTSNPAIRHGKFAGPSVLHQRDVILKGQLMI